MEIMSGGIGPPLESKGFFLENNLNDNRIFSSKTRDHCYKEEENGDISYSLIMQSYSRSGDECVVTLPPSGKKNCFSERFVSFEDNMAIVTTGDNEESQGGVKDCDNHFMIDEVHQIKSAVLIAESNSQKNAKETYDIPSLEQNCYLNVPVIINQNEEDEHNYDAVGLEDNIDDEDDAESDDDDDYLHILKKNGEPVEFGAGSFGTVYALRDSSTYQKIAMKVITVKDEKHRESALYEVKVHQQLCHKNIIQFITYYESDNIIQILMKTVSGGSLAHCLIQWGGLKEQVIVHYLRQILDAIKYMHERDIIHLDIKGDNILINEESACCKLGDFGTAHILKDGDLKTSRGTPDFMAPEVIAEESYGKPADIWSIGCTATEMAIGERPYRKLEVTSVYYRVGKEKIHPPFPSNASHRFIDFLKRCFSPEPSDRATVEELLQHSFVASGKQSQHVDVQSKCKDEPVENECEVMMQEEQTVQSDSNNNNINGNNNNNDNNNNDNNNNDNDNNNNNNNNNDDDKGNNNNQLLEESEEPGTPSDEIQSISSTFYHEVSFPQRDKMHSELCYQYTRLVSVPDDLKDLMMEEEEEEEEEEEGNFPQESSPPGDENDKIVTCLHDCSSIGVLSFLDNKGDSANKKESLYLWLDKLDVPHSEIIKFSKHHCTMDDVLDILQFEDLKDMDLSVGPRARIWTAIQQHRGLQSAQTSLLSKQNGASCSWKTFGRLVNTTLALGLEVYQKI